MHRSLPHDLRDTGLEIVAGLAESAARATPHFDRGPVRGEESRSDFLYDVVRLHLTHLNELARLGAAYSFLPARILERLYAGSAACAPRDSRSEERCAPRHAHPPVFDRETIRNNTVVFSIPLRNARFNPHTVHVDPPVFHDVATGKEQKELTALLFLNGKELDADLGDALVHTAKLQVRVTATAKVPVDKVFEARLNIRFSDADPQSCVLRLRTLG